MPGGEISLLPGGLHTCWAHADCSMWKHICVRDARTSRMCCWQELPWWELWCVWSMFRNDERCCCPAPHVQFSAETCVPAGPGAQAAISLVPHYRDFMSSRGKLGSSPTISLIVWAPLIKPLHFPCFSFLSKMEEKESAAIRTGVRVSRTFWKASNRCLNLSKGETGHVLIDLIFTVS